MSLKEQCHRQIFISLLDKLWQAGATNRDLLLTKTCYCSELYGKFIFFFSCYGISLEGCKLSVVHGFAVLKRFMMLKSSPDLSNRCDFKWYRITTSVYFSLNFSNFASSSHTAHYTTLQRVKQREWSQKNVSKGDTKGKLTAFYLQNSPFSGPFFCTKNERKI